MGQGEIILILCRISARNWADFDSPLQAKENRAHRGFRAKFKTVSTIYNVYSLYDINFKGCDYVCVRGSSDYLRPKRAFCVITFVSHIASHTVGAHGPVLMSSSLMHTSTVHLMCCLPSSTGRPLVWSTNSKTV